MKRLLAYLAENHLDEYVWAMSDDPSRGSLRDPEEYVETVLALYRAKFNPAPVVAEIAKLDAEHSALTKRYADLPTPRAKEKAAKELAELEARIGELERQREDLAGVVEHHYRQMLDLQRAIGDANLAMKQAEGERALRRRAEAIRSVVHRIECTFTATGKTGGGPGRTNARLATVTIYPVAGEPIDFQGEENVLQRTRVVSLVVVPDRVPDVGDVQRTPDPVGGGQYPDARPARARDGRGLGGAADRVPGGRNRGHPVALVTAPRTV